MSELILGTMTFGEDWGWGAPREVCGEIFESYAEAGGNVVDTASGYTNGASERIVGELLSTERDRFVVATKYSVTLDGSDPNAAGNSRKNLRRSVEQSLDRLRTDRIDLLWVHVWDPLTPVEETMRALDDLVCAGKVLYVGISDAPSWVVAQANTLADWRGWCPFIGVQVPYSLLRRDIERELLPMVGAFGLSVAAWSPLAAGVLSGKFTRGSAPTGTRIAADSIKPRDLEIASVVDDVADELGASSAQVAIAWTMARSLVHPIIGVRRISQLREALAAPDLPLPPTAMSRLDEVSMIDLGFPTDTLASSRDTVYGPVGRLVAPRVHLDSS
jgi:aryl-alcohol dehydrogenase-like predicted oxidoreductase